MSVPVDSRGGLYRASVSRIDYGKSTYSKAGVDDKVCADDPIAYVFVLHIRVIEIVQESSQEQRLAKGKSQE
jgi:hypothetical protein